MPLYEYKCKQCGEVKTALVKMDQSNAPTKCDKDGGDLEKIMSASNAKFNGKGFYCTDFKNK